MSSILRALKKLEEDSSSKGIKPIIQKTKIRQMINRRAKPTWVINRLLPILLTFLLVSTLGWIIVSSNSKRSTTKKHLKASTNPQASSSTDTTPKRFSLKSSPKYVQTVKKGSPEESVLPATDDQSNPLTESAFVINERHTQSKGASDVVKTVEMKKNDEKKTEHPEFILNGILWSHIPVKRLALINGRYLKEGDVSNGVSVLQIGKKSVLVQSGEEKWIIRLHKK